MIINILETSFVDKEIGTFRNKLKTLLNCLANYYEDIEFTEV
jgi:hypothetical protein